MDRARCVTKSFFTFVVLTPEMHTSYNVGVVAYLLKIFSAEDVTLAERESAVLRFREALESALGNEALV